ncbi:TRAP transporter substrate-binding protein [Petroclostridium sp. X23]|uniref:TRAP transporter substrate-binding protein n=1 Tax=Petroclostridium sp. X23 TaxID=3045146 RepID=UPI0024AD0350|nr:TRAP transporter substrate-binding protein [Petroclostridium sp. X23]WHH56857.1 TRAP transporter substrate-binding protein [Petroclostridium sp. X23]
MKKITVFLLSIMMMLSLVNCGKGNTVTMPNNSKGSVSGGDTQPSNPDAKRLVLTTSALDPAVAPDYNPWGDALLKFKEEVEKNSNGRYKIDIFWYFTYGSDAEMFQMIQDGETDFHFGAGMSNVDGRFAWQRIPFLLKDIDTVREKMANPKAEGFKINSELYADNGIKLLAQNTGLQRNILSSKKMIKVPSDLSGETFRTYEDAIVNTFYGGLGNIAVMPSGELYTSLQNGLVTATEQQVPSYIIEKYYEIAPYYSYVGAQWTMYSLMMNMDKFNSYSEEDQQIFIDAAWNASEAEYQSYVKMLGESEAFFDKNGVTYYQPTDEELKQWQDYAASLGDSWKGLIGAELYDRVTALFDY